MHFLILLLSLKSDDYFPLFYKSYWLHIVVITFYEPSLWSNSVLVTNFSLSCQLEEIRRNTIIPVREKLFLLSFIASALLGDLDPTEKFPISLTSCNQTILNCNYVPIRTYVRVSALKRATSAKGKLKSAISAHIFYLTSNLLWR